MRVCLHKPTCARWMQFVRTSVTVVVLNLISYEWTTPGWIFANELPLAALLIKFFFVWPTTNYPLVYESGSCRYLSARRFFVFNIRGCSLFIVIFDTLNRGDKMCNGNNTNDVQIVEGFSFQYYVANHTLIHRADVWSRFIIDIVAYINPLGIY